VTAISCSVDFFNIQKIKIICVVILCLLGLMFDVLVCLFVNVIPAFVEADAQMQMRVSARKRIRVPKNVVRKSKKRDNWKYFYIFIG
jgi:hypothetical protein